MWKWLETFIKGLKEMIAGRPYLSYVYSSAVLVIVSLPTNRLFKYTWAFLIYSVVGAVWRYIEKDVDSQLSNWLLEKYLQKKEKEELKLRIKLVVVSVYH